MNGEEKILALGLAVSVVGNAQQFDAQMINSAFKNQSDDYAAFVSKLTTDIATSFVEWLNDSA